MAKQKKDIEVEIDADLPSKEYNASKAKEEGEAIAEKMKSDPSVVPVPEGGSFDGEDPMEARAEEARVKAAQAPVMDHENGPPSPIEVIEARRRQVADRQTTRGPDPDDPFADSPGPVTEDLSPDHKFLCVIHFGGRYRLIGASSIDYMRGRVQEEKGIKRLFRYVGDTEWQEIRATGEAILR